MSEAETNFGQTLQQARKAAGLSREALAQSVNFNPSYIYRLETGTRKPSRKALLALAKAIGIENQEVSRWLVDAGFAPLPLTMMQSASRTRGIMQHAHSVVVEPSFQVTAHWTQWLESMGLQEEIIGRLLQRMAGTGTAEQRQITHAVSNMFSHLVEMLEAPVRIAVIPAAAGHPVVARHIIQRLLLRAIGEAHDAGISKVMLVIAPGTEEYFYTPLKEALDLSIAPSLNLEYVVQPQPEGLGDAILRAEKFIGKEPFAVLLPDELLRERADRATRSGELRRMMIAFGELSGANLIAVKPVPKSKMRQYGIAKVGVEYARGLFQVDELVEKPGPLSPISCSPHALGIVGRYLLRADIFHILRELKIRGERPVQLTSALELIRRRGQSVYAYDLKVAREDIGEVLSKASKIFGASSDKNPLGNKETSRWPKAYPPSSSSGRNSTSKTFHQTDPNIE